MPQVADFGNSRYPTLPSATAADYGLQGYKRQEGTIGQLANIADLTGYLVPYFNSLSTNNIGSTAKAVSNASYDTSEAQLSGLNQLYGKYGNILAETGGRVQQSAQEAAARANANTLNSASGRAAIDAALGADQHVNPEYYSTRSSTANSIQKLMDSIDLSGDLSGSETRAIGQSLAQQGVQNGTTNIPSQSQTVANAMQYGNASYARKSSAQSKLSDAISKATSFLPASNNPNVNAWAVGTGQQGSPTIGNLFSGAYNSGANIAGSASGQANSASSLYSTGAGLQSNNNNLAASQANSSAGVVGSVVSGLGGLLGLLAV